MTQYKNTLKHKQYHGGWLLYLKLVIKLYSQIPQLWNMVGQIKDNKTITRFGIVLGIFTMIIRTPYWLIIKPFGCLFSSSITYSGTHREVNNQVIDYNYTKRGIIFFLRIIPIWPIISKHINKEDKKRLFKNKVVI